MGLIQQISKLVIIRWSTHPASLVHLQQPSLQTVIGGTRAPRGWFPSHLPCAPENLPGTAATRQAGFSVVGVCRFGVVDRSDSDETFNARTRRGRVRALKVSCESEPSTTTNLPSPLTEKPAWGQTAHLLASSHYAALAFCSTSPSTLVVILPTGNITTSGTGACHTGSQTQQPA